MDPAIIRCTNLSVAYGSQVVLHNVNLAVRRGTIMPLVGPNGAGKSTLLRAILGLLKPCAGTVETPFQRSPAAYVPQQKAIDPLYPVTARQIVEMGLYRRLGWWRRARNPDRETVSAAMRMMDIEAHAGKRFAELSGGMRQKVLVARALVTAADVLVMDEPTSEMDERSEEEVLKGLSLVANHESKTVLLAIHGSGSVREIASEVCLVDHGRATLVPVHSL